MCQLERTTDQDDAKAEVVAEVLSCFCAGRGSGQGSSG